MAGGGWIYEGSDATTEESSRIAVRRLRTTSCQEDLNAPPPGGGGEGRMELSKCNNDERQWLAATASRAQVLAMRAKGLGLNESATMEQVNLLLKEIGELRASSATDWAKTANDMRTRGREEAMVQATTKWTDVVRILTEATTDAEAMKDRLKTGTRPKQAQAAASAPTPASTPSTTTTSTPLATSSSSASAAGTTTTQAAASQVVTGVTPMGPKQLQEMLGRQIADQMSQVRREFEEREKHMKEEYERKLREENDRMVRYSDELKKIEAEVKKRREENMHREHEQQAEIQKLQEQLRTMQQREQDRDTDTRRGRPFESARERLHRELSPPQRQYNRLGAPWRHAMPSDTANARGSGRGGDEGRWQNNDVRETHRQSAGGGILARFGAYAGQVDMPETDPYQTTMEDENAAYYEESFPPPFNQAPPQDGPRITEFRKLEGLVHKFNGGEDEFHGWVALFVPNIHRAKCPVAWKATILNKCMDTTNSTLKNIVATSGATKDEYANTIHKLMRAFAHPQGIVAAKLRALETITYVGEGEHDSMEEWLIKLEAYLAAARTRGMQADIFSVQLYEESLAKMDDSLARDYLMWASLKDLPNNAVTVCAWLEEKVSHIKQLRRRRTVTENRTMVANRARPRSSPPGKRTPRGATGTHERAAPWEGDRRRRRASCPLDGEGHGLEQCPKFKALSPNERRQKLRDWQRCYACFATGHNISNCIKNIRCSECTHYHHTLLHGSSSNRRGVRRATDSRTMLTIGRDEDGDGAHSDDDDDTWSESSEPATDDFKAFKSVGRQKSSRVVLQTIPIEVYNGKKKVRLNCLIDQGATGAFMSRRAAEELEVTGHTATARVTGFDGMVSQGQVLITSVQVTALGNRKKHWVQVQVTKDPAGSYQPHDWTRDQAKYKHIKSLPILPPIPNKNVDIMLGMDTPDLIKSLVPDVGGHEGQPLARFTKLGWVVSGPTRMEGDEECRANFVFKAAGWEIDGPAWSAHALRTTMPDARQISYTGRKEEDDIKQLLVRMWELEVAPEKTTSSLLDDKLFRFLRQELQQTEDKKYLLPTLWRTGHPHIDNNFKYAETRLKSILGSKQLRDPRVAAEYRAQFRDWEAKGYTEEVATDSPEADRAFYLPHFAVVRWDKLTTKVRIVMDGAAKPSKSGMQLCLNDCLQKGPKLVNDLPLVLMRFRLKKVAIAADVKKMFFQIKLRKKDRDYHRFLWKEGNKLKVYRWAVHPFGSAASPCVAIFTIKEHASRWKGKFPQAAETVIHSTLVDDNLDSCDSVQEATDLGRQLVGLFAEAGMQLGKIMSSHREVREAFPEEMRAESLDVAEFCTQDLDNPVVKTLGIIYLSKEDAFGYAANIPEVKKWTKRTILQHKAKLYDPHGLISPHTIVAGIILQKLWRLGRNWDEEVGGEELRRWESWLQQSRELPTLRVPRCLSQHPQEKAEIHFFCDASADAYAAVAYYVTPSQSRLIGSKGKVAPLKSTSIPRLELVAAELVLELIKWTKNTIPVPKSDYWYWSDSRNVLAWLQTESRSLQELVANRVSKITEDTDAGHWRWVPTHLNPADIPSRGATADKLRGSSLWWEGPEFLRTRQWPRQPGELQMPDEATRELKKSAAFTSRQDTLKDEYDQTRNVWHHVESKRWRRTVRAFSWCRRWVRKKEERAAPLEKEELEDTEARLIRHMQEAALAASTRAVTTCTSLPKGSPLAKLDPFLDQDGLLRVGGRMSQARYVPFAQRHQIIVPKDHPWTQSIIRDVHEQLLHQGAAHVTIALRKKFWILRATQKVRAVLAGCKSCARQRARAKPQKMAPIIEDRYPETRCRPFTYTAVDAAGPYYIHNQKENKVEKAYFLLFTCCTIRAVHLEAIFDMSANSFLAALDRFTARRGNPTRIRSDNGTNFRAAYSDLQKLWSKMATDHYRKERPQFEWLFNPPKAPYFGGLYERLVGAAKRALYHVAKANSATSRENFITMLTVVEGILNSRPITCVSPDTDAPEALTPSHFLGTGPYTQIARPGSEPWDQKTLWRAHQRRLDGFWKRFCREVRSSLQPASIWQKERPALKPGDVVVVLENKERGVWPLARVVRVEQSRDGLVRKVEILYKGHTVRRAVNSLMLLEPAEKAKALREAVSESTEAGAVDHNTSS